MKAHRLSKSLGGRIVLPFALALVIVFAIASYYLGQTVRSEGLRELRERAGLLAGTIAYNAELPLLARDSRALGTLLEGASRDPDLVAAEIQDEAGVRLARFAPAGRAGFS